MTRSNTTPFSFHCMICFEEFDPDSRYPVVLPCGHTYVCQICANRLEKCMECRTPLFELIPNSNNAGISASIPRSAWSSARPPPRSGSRTNSPPLPQPPVKRRLALPKNVVLLSLIEATELATADASSREHYKESPRSTANGGSPSFDEHLHGTPTPDLHSMGSMLDREDEDDDDNTGDNAIDDEQQEEEKIKMSTSLAVGVAGTYAVAVKEGLDIFPNRPVMSTMDVSQSTGQEDVESLVRVYQVDHSKDFDESAKRKDPLRLCYGDRVQIVAVGGGWARLSRGYGYVRTDGNQLVKVSGTLDRSCKLEAMLCSLSNRRKQLRYEQSKIDNQFIRLMNELQHSLQNDEDLTVIPADTFSKPPEIPITEKEEKTQSPTDFSYYPEKPAPRPSTPPLDTQRRGFGCFAFGDSAPGTPSDMLRSALSSTDMRGLFPTASHPSPSAMRAGAQAWREQRGRTAAINFRTGMSGHMGILSTQSHAHEYLGQEQRRTPGSNVSRQTMSSHTGLTMTKGLTSFHGIFNSLTLPLIGTPPRADDNDGCIGRTGSM